MTQRRVLVLTQMYPRKGSPMRGIFIHRQVKELVRLGCEVKVVCPVPYVPDLSVARRLQRKYGKTPLRDCIDGIEVLYPRYFRLPGQHFHPLAAIAMSRGGVAHAVTQLVGSWRPHLLHAHTATPAGFAATRIAQRHDLPVVLHLRGSDINVYPYRDPWTMRLTRYALRRADSIIAVSSDLAEKATAIAQPRHPIETVYAGCDLDLFQRDEKAGAAARQRLGIPIDCTAFVYVGNLLREKGAFDLLSAFCRLVRRSERCAHVLFVGDGEQRQQLESDASTYNLQDRTHFVGAVEQGDIPTLLSASDVFVLPSWHEGLPNALIEAMSCGLPAVATAVGGIPEVIEDGISGILVPRQAEEELLNALEHLLSDPGARERMGQSAREAVKQRFSWPKNAQQTMGIYEKVLRER